MTISNTDDPVAGPFEGDDSQTAFPFTFKVFATSDLDGGVVADIGGVAVNLVRDSDYSVSLNADQNANPGGTVTYPLSGSPLATGDSLTIASNLEATQPASIPNRSGFYAQVVENALDRVTMLIKQASAGLSRSLRFPLADFGVNTELPSAFDRALKALTFDSDGNPICTTPSAGSADALASDLLRNDSATRGLGMSGFSPAITYPTDTAAAQFGRRVSFDNMGGSPSASAATNAAAYAEALAVLVNTGYGGKIVFGRGFYSFSSTVTINADDVEVCGEGTTGNHFTASPAAAIGGTVLSFSNTTGACVHLQGQGCGLSDLTVTGNATRYAQAYAASKPGVLIAGPDTASGNSRRNKIRNVHVMWQPGDGFDWIGEITASKMVDCDCDNIKGVPLRVDGGAFVGRVNQSRPGQFDVESFRGSRSGGPCYIIGNPTASANDRPYRIRLINVEGFFNRQDSVNFTDAYAGLIHGENITLDGCGTGGEISSGVSDHASLRLSGKGIRVKNHRAVDNELHVVRIYDPGVGVTTRDISVELGYISQANHGPNYFSPAVIVDDTAPDCEAIYNGGDSSVASLTESNAPRLRTVFNGVESFSSHYESSFLSGSIVLADDKAGYIEFSAEAHGQIAFSANVSGGGSQILHFRCGSGSAFLEKAANDTGGVTVDVGTGSLANADGVDNRLTVSAGTLTPRLYLSNRTGTSVTYRFTVLSSSVPLLGQPITNF